MTKQKYFIGGQLIVCLFLVCYLLKLSKILKTKTALQSHCACIFDVFLEASTNQFILLVTRRINSLPKSSPP